jgi:hypothetical protein
MVHISQVKEAAWVRKQVGDEAGKWGRPEHRANLRRLAFYLKTMGSP